MSEKAIYSPQEIKIAMQTLALNDWITSESQQAASV
jgi:hypothetical protein